MLNWRRCLIVSIAYALAVILQYGFLNNLGWGVFCPQLLIFFPIFAGILEGARSGVICGFVSGLFMDLFTGRFIGIWILVWVLIGFLSGRYGSRFFKENYLLPVFAVAVCNTLANLLYALLIGLVGDYWLAAGQLFAIIGGTALVDCILAAVLYLPLYRSVNYGWLKHVDKAQKNSFS